MTDAEMISSAASETGPATGDAQSAPRHGTPETAIDAIQALLADPKSTANAIDRNEFSAGGAGLLGTAFRMTAAADSREREEAFSLLIELAFHLWEKGYRKSSRTMMDQARIRLEVPQIFQDRIDAAIEQADQEILIDRIRKRYEEGDDEGAQGLLQNLKGPVREEVGKELETLTRNRRTWRRNAFVFSGILVALLLILLARGLVYTYDFARNPPSFSLPSYPEAGIVDIIVGDNSSPETEDPARLSRLDNIHDALKDKPTEWEPTEEEFAEIFGMPQDPADTEEPAQAPAPELADPVSLPDPLDDEAVRGCALAELSLARAMQMAGIDDPRSGGSIMGDFFTRITKACPRERLPDDLYQRYLETISSSEIETIAESLVTNPR